VPASLLSHVVNRDDIGVLDSCCCSRLAQKALNEHLIPGQMRCQYFYGNVAVQVWIVTPKNGRHSPAPDLGLDSVFAQCCVFQVVTFHRSS
jgi:hypothetical protein